VKKRVRYLVGAATLVPGAAGLGLAAPGMAQAAGCTGHVEFTLPTNSGVRGHGWYTKNGNNVCIGTVVVSVYTSKTGDDYPQLAVYWSSGATWGPRTASVYQTKGHWGAHSFGVHESNRAVGGASVWAWSEFGGGTHNGHVG
jgi:hypothetical protein